MQKAMSVRRVINRDVPKKTKVAEVFRGYIQAWKLDTWSAMTKAYCRTSIHLLGKDLEYVSHVVELQLYERSQIV